MVIINRCVEIEMGLVLRLKEFIHEVVIFSRVVRTAVRRIKIVDAGDPGVAGLREWRSPS
jgi:hypothetical protein